MEPEDLEDRLRRHEAMLEGLAKVWMRQSEINERMDGAIARLDKTQADITLLLQRVIRGSGNGREA